MSINKTLYNRLSAQIEELSNLGFEKEASHFAPKVYGLSTRDDSSEPKFTPQDLELAIQADLLSALIKVADFYGASHIALDEVLPYLEEDAGFIIDKYKKIQKIALISSPMEEKLPGEDGG